MTNRLALAIYFVLWLAWLVPWYFRRYHRRERPEASVPPDSGSGRALLYLIIWATLITAIATAWRVLHPQAGS